MGIIKRKLAYDSNAIAPIFIAVGLILTLAVSSAIIIGVYQLTQKPDVTYNITDTGFSLAGLNLDSTMLMLIAGVVGVIILMAWVRKK